MTKSLRQRCSGKIKRVAMLFVGAVCVAVIIGSSVSVAADSEELSLFGLINSYREQNGLDKLAFSDALAKAALGHSSDMAAKDYFSHKTIDGTSFIDRIETAGYKTDTGLGENIAAGMSKGAETFEAWRKSPDHRSIMLAKDFKAIGIGRAYSSRSSYGWYWTADFGGYVDSTAQSILDSGSSSGTNQVSLQSNNSDWGSDYIKWMVDNKGLKGYPDGSLRSGNSITRAELAVMISTAFEITPGGKTVFKDVADNWARSYIAALADKSILTGFVDGKFRPFDMVTRAEMTQAITKAAGLRLPKATDDKEFKDTAGHWAQDSIAIASSNNIVKGYSNGKFKPDATCTRAEAAAVLWRLVK